MSDDPADAVLEALADPETRRVLTALDEPMTAREVSEHCDIPQSTAYRKLDELESAGLLRADVRLTDTGTHPTVYERAFDGAHVRLRSDGLHFELEPRHEATPSR